MKKMKKIAAFAAATVMAVSMASMSASATGNTTGTPVEGTYSTVEIKSTHTYKYFKIFDGDFETVDSEKVIVDPALSTGVDAGALKTALGASATSEKPADLAKAMEGMTGKNLAKLIVDNKTAIFGAATGTELADGDTLTNGYYYLEETADGKTTPLLLIVDGSEKVTIHTKLGAPLVEKKVQDNETDEPTQTKSAIGDDIYSDSTAENKFNDTADYSIGDNVPFEILGTIPENIDEYTHYFYEFTDTLGKGFNKPTDVTVTLIKKADGSKSTLTVTPTVTGDDTTEKTIKFTFNDIKAEGVAAGDVIKIAYKAQLNSSAVIGKMGNTNGVDLTYSKTTSYDGNGYENTPDGETKKENETTTTTKDGVGVFTYQIDATKVDGASTTKKLAGAKFKLLNSDKSKAAVFADGKFEKWADDVAGGTEFETTETGLFTVAGLDEGTYYIKETDAPEGYNKLEEPIKIDLLADTHNDSGYTYVKDDASAGFISLTAKIDDAHVTAGDPPAIVDHKDTGVVPVEIKNNKGSKIPETGGIGTKIFTVAGGTIAVGAGVLLITKKRMKKED